MLRRMFGSKRAEMTGGWRELHNDGIHNVYSSPSIIRMIKSRRMRWTGPVTRMVKRNAYRILVGKPRLLETPRHSWVDNNKMDFREIGWGGMHWIDLAQDSDQ
jgi:hypothetical protein